MADPYNEGITLKIKVTPRAIERVIYLTIIIILASFLVFNIVSDRSSADKEEKKVTEMTGAAANSAEGQNNTGETTQEEAVAEEEPQVIEEAAAEEPAANETAAAANETAEINETAEANETTEINETEETNSSGSVDLTINEVMTELKNGGTYGKVTGVRFTISNEKEDFMPSVEVYTYEDGETATIFTSTPRVERVYSTLKLGQTNSYELDITSQQFTDLENYVICNVVVKDKTSDKAWATATEKLKIS
jgi:type II secretory pathway pseudopilin PulG